MTYTTSKTLLEKIKSGDDISWNEFYLRYAPFISGIGHRFGLNQNEIDEGCLYLFEGELSL